MLKSQYNLSLPRNVNSDDLQSEDSDIQLNLIVQNRPVYGQFVKYTSPCETNYSRVATFTERHLNQGIVAFATSRKFINNPKAEDVG